MNSTLYPDCRSRRVHPVYPEGFCPKGPEPATVDARGIPTQLSFSVLCVLRDSVANPSRSANAQPQLSSFQRLAHSLSPFFIFRALFSAAYRLFLQIQGGGRVFADAEPFLRGKGAFVRDFPGSANSVSHVNSETSSDESRWRSRGGRTR